MTTKAQLPSCNPSTQLVPNQFTLASTSFMLGDQEVHVDDKNFINLTEIWKSSGLGQDRHPAHFLRLKGTKQFIKHVQKGVKCKSVLYSKKGYTKSGTYGHWQIALAYAKWLSSELHMQVNEVFIRYKSADPTLADEMSDRMTPEQQRWLSRRLQGKITRSAFTKTLADHGCRSGGIAQCTNAIYRPILGGTALEIRRDRGLSDTANLREGMSTIELSASMFAEDLAQRDIEVKNDQGLRQCKATCKEAGERVASIL